MRKHSIGGKRILVWIVGLLLIINQSVFLSESMVYGLTGDPGSTETVFMLTDQLEADQNYVIASGDSGKVSILEGDDSGINSLSAEVITDENGTYIKELPADAVWTADGDGTSGAVLFNDSYAVTLDENSELGVTDSADEEASAWSYDSKKLQLHTSSADSAAYMVYNDGFEASEEGDGVYLYVETEIPDIQDEEVNSDSDPPEEDVTTEDGVDDNSINEEEAEKTEETPAVKGAAPAAAEKSATEEAIPEAEEPAAVKSIGAPSSGTVLAFTSDIHNTSNNTAANRLDTWLDKIAGIYGGINVMSFCGDMGGASLNESQFWTCTQSVMNVVSEEDLQAVYTTGNHEFYNGQFSNTSSNLKPQFKIGEEGLNGSNYRIYCLGTDNWNNSSDNYTTGQISTLSNYLNNAGNSKPIIILTHFPLHYYSSGGGWGGGRQTTNADQVIDVLNNAATANQQKIVLLWGHNHTVSDTHYDQIYAPGDSIEYSSGNSKELNFYYGAAGCMSDTEYGNGSAYVKGKGLVIQINSKNQLSFTYYDANGNNVTEGGTFTEQDPVYVTSVSIDQESATVEVGKNVTLTASVEPSDATNKSVAWSTSDDSIATVDSQGKVKGVSPGTATITATSNHTEDGSAVSDSIEVTVTPRSGNEPMYVLTDTLKAGKNYIIANKNTGEAYALTNNNGSVSKTAVTIDGDTIYTDNENIVFTTEGSGTNVSNIVNGGRYVVVSNGSLSLNASAQSNRPWSYGDDSKLTVRSGNSTYYLYYSTYNNGNFSGSTSATSSSSPREVYLFEEVEEQVAVTGVTVDPAEASVMTRNTVQLTATISPENATNKKVTWRSSDTSVATVDANGKVKGVSEGTATITVTTADGGKTATCAVTVTENPNPEQHYIIKIGDFALSTEISPNTAQGGSSSYTYTGLAGVEYTSGETANDSIRWIIEETDGGYYIKSLDGLYLNATYDSGNNSGHGHLQLGDTPDVWVLDDGHSLEGGTVDGSKLKSTNASAGLDKPKYLGYEEDPANLFTVRSADNADEISIVEAEDPVAVTGVTVDPAEATVEVSKTVPLTATVSPANATNKNVSWTSSDPSVATVDENGKVKGIKEGTATITVITADGNKTAECAVTVTASTSTEKHYVITVGNFALSTDPTEDRLSNNNGAYVYTGLAGVAFDPEETAADSIRWILEEVEGVENGYYIKSLDGRYLNATYTAATNPSASNPTRGVLKLDDTPDVWVLDGSLDSWEVDGSMLKSTNASATASSAKFLAYEEGTSSSPLNLFTIRSESNADETHVVEAEDPVVTYEFTADDIRVKANEDGTVDSKTITSKLTVNGEEVTPTTLSYEVKTDGDGIIKSIADDGAITFNKDKTGQAEVTVSFTYTPNRSGGRSVNVGADGTVTGSEDITVTVTGYTPHSWSTDPVWVWAEDYSSATAKFACLEDGCDEEFEAAAEIEVTENEPTCQEAKVTTYTATATGPDGNTYTDTKTSGGTHEVYVYKLVNSITAGKEYLIVNTDAAGNGYVLTQNDGTVSASADTIHAPEEDDDIDANYIIADEVPAGAVWTASPYTATISNNSYDGFKLTNNGYYLQVTGQYSDLVAVTSQTYSESVWNYSRSTANALDYHYSGNSGRDNTRYAIFSDNNFIGDTEAANVYIYERTTMTEGEMGPHSYQYEAMNWDEGYAAAHAVFRCSVCDTTATVDAEVTTEDRDADCELPTRTAYIATVSADNSLDGKEHVDDSQYVAKLFPETVTKELKVYKLVNSITSGKNYLIVNANTEGTAHAVANGNDTDGSSATDENETIISGKIDGTDAIYIESTNVDDSAVWTAGGSSTSVNLKNGNCYLYPSANGLRVDTTSRNWTASSIASDHYLRYSSGGSNYYLNYSDAWACTRSSSSSTYKVYFFEETTGVVETTEYHEEPALGHKMPLAHTDAKDAKCTEDGNIEYWTCERCGQHFADAEGNTKITEEDIVIPATGHTPVTDAAVAPTCTETGLTEGSHCSVCGEVIAAQETVPAAGHKYVTDEAVSPTCTETGLTQGSHCSVCGETFLPQAEIPALGHDWGTPSYEWSTDNSTATAKRVCKRDATHVETESVDTTNVVTEPTCEDAGYTTYTAEFTNEAFGTKTQKVAGEAALGHDWKFVEITWTESEDGGYTAVASYKCERNDEHTQTVDAVIEKTSSDATCTEAGTVTYTATVSANASLDGTTRTDTRIEEGSVLGHDPEHHEAVAATCKAEGNIEYWTCKREGCGKYFSDEACETEITAAETVIAKTDHTPGEAVRENEVAATCTAEGSYDEVVYCTVCEAELSRTPKTIEKIAHSWNEGEVTKEATCTEAGEKTFTCGVCETTKTEPIAALGHDPEHHEAVAATCKAEGNIEYWTCKREGCGRYFSDEACKNEITAAETVIAKTAHTLGEPSYEWLDDNLKVKAEVVCSVCGEVETETVNTTKAVTEPTCEAAGYTTYTAEFTNEAFETKTKKVEGDPATGHAWGEPSYEWSSDNSKVTAKRVCGNDAGHVETEIVNATSKVTKEATTTAAGEEVWTSDAFENEAFAVQTKTVEIPAKKPNDPTYGEPAWNWNGYDSATATFKSTNGGETQTVKASVTAKVSTGKAVYTATAKGPDGKAYTSTRTRTYSGVLVSQAAAKGSKQFTIKWTQVKGADGYDIFMAKCDGGGVKYKMEKIKTLSGSSAVSWTTPSNLKVSGAKLKAKTAYKANVKAYVLVNGKHVYINTSPMIHAFASGVSGKYCNTKGVKLSSKSKVSIKKGKTSKIKASATKLKKNKTLIPKDHAAHIRYMSSNTKIATVSAKGVIKGKAKGTCYIYVYTVNGAYKTVKVTVK